MAKSRFLQSLSSSEGMSLIQALNFIAIVGISTMAIGTLMNRQMKNVKAVSEQLEALSLEENLKIVLDDKATCDSIVFNPASPITFNPTTVNASNPFETNLQALSQYANINSSDPSSGNVKIESIKLKVTDPTLTSNEYNAEIKINFVPNNLAAPLKPLTISLPIITTPISSNLVQISGCKLSNGIPPEFEGKEIKITPVTPLGVSDQYIHEHYYEGINTKNYPIFVSASRGRHLYTYKGPNQPPTLFPNPDGGGTKISKSSSLYGGTASGSGGATANNNQGDVSEGTVEFYVLPGETYWIKSQPFLGTSNTGSPPQSVFRQRYSSGWYYFSRGYFYVTEIH